MESIFTKCIRWSCSFNETNFSLSYIFSEKPNLKAGHKGISDKFHIMRPNVDGLTIVVLFCAKGSVIVMVTAVQCRHHCTIKAIANNEY